MKFVEDFVNRKKGDGVKGLHPSLVANLVARGIVSDDGEITQKKTKKKA